MDETITKIDVTPLVSVALILVIIFTVTAPIIMAPLDSEIQLPKAATYEAKSQKSINVSLAPDLRIAIDEHWVAEEFVISTLESALALDPEKLVLIRADKNVRHREVLSLLGRAKRAGATRIAIATEQRSRKQ
jgi:biopolymer transport protein ExbD